MIVAYLPGRRKTAPERTCLSAALDNSVREWRIDATQEHLLAWIAANRYVPGLTCQQRAQYHVGRCVRGLVPNCLAYHRYSRWGPRGQIATD